VGKERRENAMLICVWHGFELTDRMFPRREKGSELRKYENLDLRERAFKIRGEYRD
jgi:hypothetical protein